MSKFVNYLWENFTIKKSEERVPIEVSESAKTSKNYQLLKGYLKWDFEKGS